MRKISLLLNTVRYLKIKQILFQIYYRLVKPKARILAVPVLRGGLKHWHGIRYSDSPTIDGRLFTFLGRAASVDGDWNRAGLPKLWLYNLHYQDYLMSSPELSDEIKRDLLDQWIVSNPPFSGNGWEPYCLSLRIVNWVKFFSTCDQKSLDSSWLESLAIQADALQQQLEYHILANHLFANAKALIFAGSFLGAEQGNDLLAKGLFLLDQQLEEQFLADGGHYERSPMYQAILLWDLADLIFLARSSELPELLVRIDSWWSIFSKGMCWFAAMCHPDGDLSFFNDATLGISPTYSDLVRYAHIIDIHPDDKLDADTLNAKMLSETGYVNVCWPGKHCLIADVAEVGPNYQPGHAHADTLSFELSVFGQRLFVNSGISQYGEDEERHRQRSTAAHNTVVVDGENSSEVWAGFRVARRARPFCIDFECTETFAKLSASHDGYLRLPGRVVHRREWLATPSGLSISDTLSGSFKSAVGFLHVHPDVVVASVSNSVVRFVLKQGQIVTMNVVGANISIVDSVWHPGFGLNVPNAKIVLNFLGSATELNIDWSGT